MKQTTKQQINDLMLNAEHGYKCAYDMERHVLENQSPLSDCEVAQDYRTQSDKDMNKALFMFFNIN